MEIVFQQPLMFLFLLGIPILIILHYYFFEHNKRRAMKFSNFSAMKRVSGTHLITKNTYQLILRVTTFLLLILTATSPILWYQGSVNSNNYVIAVDTSASMIATDVEPNRLTLAKNSAIAFVDNLDVQTNIGILSFSGISKILSPLSTKKTNTKSALEALEIDLSGGTDIGAALLTATNMLAHGNTSKTIILISDGSETAGSFIDNSVDLGIQYVQDNHVTVHTIGIGTGSSDVGYIDNIQLRAVYDKTLLENLATSTGGNFFEVTNSAEINAAFQSITIEKTNGYISRSLSSPLLIISLLLLLVEWVLLNTRFRALP